MKKYETDFNNLSMNEKISVVNDRLNSLTKGKDLKGDNKDFKLPFMLRMKLKSQSKKNKVLVIYLNNSRNLKFLFTTIDNGMILVKDKITGDKYYNAAQAFAFIYNKYPVYIVKEWSIDPVGSKDYASDVENGRLIDPQTITIRAIEAREAMMKKPFSGMMIWVLVAIGVAVVAYIIFTQKK